MSWEICDSLFCVHVTTPSSKSTVWCHGFRSETLSRPCQELFAKIITNFQLSTIFIKSFIIDLREGPKYASGGARETENDKTFFQL